MKKSWKTLAFIVSVVLNMVLIFLLAQNTLSKNVTPIGTFGAENSLQVTVSQENEFFLYENGKEIHSGKTSFKDKLLFLKENGKDVGVLVLESKAKNTLIYDGVASVLVKNSDTPIFIK